MLVLGRKVGESIVLNGNIIVTIIRVNGEKVRLGIEAPQEVRILRQEVIKDVKTIPQQLLSGPPNETRSS
jgi:carbon storage regulator